jgi:hypothetical protein
VRLVTVLAANQHPLLLAVISIHQGEGEIKGIQDISFSLLLITKKMYRSSIFWLIKNSAIISIYGMINIIHLGNCDRTVA